MRTDFPRARSFSRGRIAVAYARTLMQTELFRRRKPRASVVARSSRAVVSLSHQNPPGNHRARAYTRVSAERIIQLRAWCTISINRRVSATFFTVSTPPWWKHPRHARIFLAGENSCMIHATLGRHLSHSIIIRVEIACALSRSSLHEGTWKLMGLIGGKKKETLAAGRVDVSPLFLHFYVGD